MELATTVLSSRKRSWTSHIHQNHIKSPWRQQGCWESADAEWLLSCWRGVSQVARRRLQPTLSWFYLYFPHFSFLKYFKLFFCYQFSSVPQSCLTFWDPMNRTTPGLPVHHQLPEFTQTHIHWVSDAIQPSYSLSSPSPPAPNPSQHQSLFQWVNSSHEVAKVLEFQL